MSLADIRRIVGDVLKNKVVFSPALVGTGQWLEHSDTALSTTVITRVQIQRDVNGILVQATGGDIRYTLTDEVLPSQTSGFKLWNGNDPIAIWVIEGQTVCFVAEDAGAHLQLQQGRLVS